MDYQDTLAVLYFTEKLSHNLSQMYLGFKRQLNYSRKVKTQNLPAQQIQGRGYFGLLPVMRNLTSAFLGAYMLFHKSVRSDDCGLDNLHRI